MYLYSVEKGRSCVITHMDIPLKIKDRLFYTGVFVNAKVTVLNRAPFLGPILIRAGEITVGIRKELAQKIMVKEIV